MFTSAMQTNAAIPECAHDRTRRTEATDRVGYRVALVVVGLVPGDTHTHRERWRDAWVRRTKRGRPRRHTKTDAITTIIIVRRPETEGRLTHETNKGG